MRAAIEEERTKRPFEVIAWVLLPDHMHAIWTLPRGDDDYALRWKRIKETFSKGYLAAGGTESVRNASRIVRKERAIWQRRFWEHTIRDENDFERHFDYIHYNPVKHGYVNHPIDWPYSTVHRWTKAGVYSLDWGRGQLTFNDLDETAME